MSEPQEVERVDARSLRLSAALGSGGQGTVYAVDERLVDERFPAVYKEFATAADALALLRVVRFRRSLSPAEAQRLDEIAAWPAAIVHRDGRITGFLMRRAPDPFLIGLGMPSGPTQHLAQVQLLLNDAAYRTARGLTIDDRFRLELLHDTASAIEFLHAHTVVVGDLSPANLLFSRSRRPRCFFLDCDAMRVRGVSVLRQAETIDWQTPSRQEQVATWATDSYKFGLLCIRLFAGDQSARDPQVLDRAGLAVKILAARSLSRDPRRRPVMAEWREALSAAAPPRPRGLSTMTQPARRIGLVGVTLVFAALLLFVAFRLPSCADVGQAFTGDRAGAAEQADGVARVLNDAGPVRQRAADAVRNVAACTDVHTAAAALRAGAAARGASLERARTLAVDLLDRGDELRAQLVVALAHAQRADEAYAVWAEAVDLTGCRSAAMHGPERRAGDAEAQAATAARKQVAELWNPLAERYGRRALSDQDL
jgi:hypothetical protein